jgi:hypothetical protein
MPPLPTFSDTLLNMQNDQPLLSDYDKECLASLGQVSSRDEYWFAPRGHLACLA